MKTNSLLYQTGMNILFSLFIILSLFFLYAKQGRISYEHAQQLHNMKQMQNKDSLN